MVAGMDADLTAVPVQTSSDAVATGIGILTTLDGDAVIAIAISIMTAGVAAATGK